MTFLIDKGRAAPQAVARIGFSRRPAGLAATLSCTAAPFIVNASFAAR
jgi:hypothetical protein